jgi:transposase-like protein
MTCPKCGNIFYVKRGKSQGKQRYLCLNCHSSFLDNYSHYPEEFKLKVVKEFIELKKEKIRNSSLKVALKYGVNQQNILVWQKRYKNDI